MAHVSGRGITVVLCGVFIFCPALHQFLALDTTNLHPYNWTTYNCKNYTFDLHHNLSSVGFDAHKVFFWTPGRPGHWMVLVYWNNITYIIEPQSDTIYTNTTTLQQHLRRLMYPWYRGQVPEQVAVSLRRGYQRVSFEKLWRTRFL